MELDFASTFEGYDAYENHYMLLTAKALKILSLKIDPIISTTFVDNKYIREVNKKYRGIDKETDVISFAFIDSSNNKEKFLCSSKTVVLGDIYISLEKAKEQAKEYNHSLDRELSFLYVHGLLHLLGYDHIKKEDEEVMFALQKKILD